MVNINFRSVVLDAPDVHRSRTLGVDEVPVDIGDDEVPSTADTKRGIDVRVRRRAKAADVCAEELVAGPIEVFLAALIEARETELQNEQRQQHLQGDPPADRSPYRSRIATAAC